MWFFFCYRQSPCLETYQARVGARALWLLQEGMETTCYGHTILVDLVAEWQVTSAETKISQFLTHSPVAAKMEKDFKRRYKEQFSEIFWSSSREWSTLIWNAIFSPKWRKNQRCFGINFFGLITYYRPGSNQIKRNLLLKTY